MPTTHIVEQGQYLSLIADLYGFQSYKTIWEDPANSDLKSLRKNPNVLLPGDRLSIPDKDVKEESRPTEARHRFQAKSAPLSLRLVIKGPDGKPVANKQARLDVEGTSTTLTTDSGGMIKQNIPRSTRQGKLVIEPGAAQADDHPIDVDADIGVGELDPVDVVTGQIGRLNNLGYDAGPPEEPLTDPAKQQFKSAVEEFQCNNALAVDGICGPNTQAKLKELHGC